jgi:hypothetical protein
VNVVLVSGEPASVSTQIGHFEHIARHAVVVDAKAAVKAVAAKASAFEDISSIAVIALPVNVHGADLVRTEFKFTTTAHVRANVALAACAAVVLADRRVAFLGTIAAPHTECVARLAGAG